MTALTLAAIFTSTTSLQAEDVIPAEVPTAVELSNTDIYRSVCPGPLRDLIFSKEKGMTGHFPGKNAFVKFKIEDNGTDYSQFHTT
jgi:conjugal transfer pilus assembly protein TraK